jgi:hypothetical protein
LSAPAPLEWESRNQARGPMKEEVVTENDAGNAIVLGPDWSEPKKEDRLPLVASRSAPA